jgi:hypothetical protein
MTAAQAATLKRLAQDAYELDAFRPNLTSAEADIRITMLTAKPSCLAGRRIRSESAASAGLSELGLWRDYAARNSEIGSGGIGLCPA